MTDQTGGVELLLASPAGEARQLEVGSVEDGETDHTVIHALEALVDVPPPDPQAVHNAAVLQQAPTGRQNIKFYNVHRGYITRVFIFFFICLCFKWFSFLTIARKITTVIEISRHCQEKLNPFTACTCCILVNNNWCSKLVLVR